MVHPLPCLAFMNKELAINKVTKARVIFWDFDDVIKDSVSVKTKAFSILFEKYGREIQEKVVSYHLENGGVSRFDKVKYFYADPTFIVKPEKDIEMPECDIKFNLKEDVYINLDKTATQLQLNDVYLKGCEKSNKMYLCATNKKNDSSNDYSEEVGEGVAKKFNVVMKKENLKIIPGDYNVSISSKGISYFKSVNTDLEYWIALEPTSEYGE